MNSTIVCLLKDSIDRLQALLMNRISVCDSPAEQIRIETKWVDKLQRRLEYGNRNVLRNFKLRLVMDDE
jgi:hypothetical protein